MKRGFIVEFKKQIRLALTAAIGFILAYAWKDYILRVIGSTFDDVRLLFPTTSYLLTALLLTFIGVITILISSKMLN